MKCGLIMKRNVIVKVLLDIAILTLYLMLMFARGCRRHCPLISPRCGKGAEQAELAKEEYVQMYGEG